ncbi:hypothetical protein QBC34DRAFT_403154 [Podospora aff. communis PSN243]|uniref:Uncharacterized protein n=1 Tax=Podospora aff. communis PSN243 TaxID=3040156 RepID=A0AAV9GQN2_9PEZI|nr:hypothetical protein QBC34DRAFT_403154 [Podospora aff. communis PSN243]
MHQEEPEWLGDFTHDRLQPHTSTPWELAMRPRNTGRASTTACWAAFLPCSASPTCPKSISKGSALLLSQSRAAWNPDSGVLVAKESSSTSGAESLDKVDGSVTRLDSGFLRMFKGGGV